MAIPHIVYEGRTYIGQVAFDSAYAAYQVERKEIRFSHDPTMYGNCALKKEWIYLQNKYGYTRLLKKGEFLYAVK